MLPLILITNDDGLESPALIAAAKALKPLGELLIACGLIGERQLMLVTPR